MARQVISEAELSQWIQSQLDADEDCDGVKFEGSFTRLLVQDESACNWSPIVIVRNSDGYSTDCRNRLQHAVQRAQQQFNLA